MVLTRSVKVAGELRRAGDILTDLSPELAFEIIEAGWGDWEQVGVPLDEFTDEDGNPVDLSGLETDGTGAGDGDGEGDGDDTEENSETA